MEKDDTLGQPCSDRKMQAFFPEWVKKHFSNKFFTSFPIQQSQRTSNAERIFAKNKIELLWNLTADGRRTAAEMRYKTFTLWINTHWETQNTCLMVVQLSSDHTEGVLCKVTIDVNFGHAGGRSGMDPFFVLIVVCHHKSTSGDDRCFFHFFLSFDRWFNSVSKEKEWSFFFQIQSNEIVDGGHMRWAINVRENCVAQQQFFVRSSIEVDVVINTQHSQQAQVSEQATNWLTEWCGRNETANCCQ